MRTLIPSLVVALALLSSRAVLAAGPPPAPTARPAAPRSDVTAPARGRPASAAEVERYSAREREARPLEQFEGGRMSDVALILVIVLIVLIIAILI